MVGATAGPVLTELITYSGKHSGTSVARSCPSRTVAAAEDALRSGKLDVAVVDGDKIVVDQPITANDSSTRPRLVQILAPELGILHAYRVRRADRPHRSSRWPRPGRFPCRACSRARSKSSRKTHRRSIGIILLFLMLTQYNTWILMGVMQEKASRVVEVLLATVRPIQLLGGKVLGIGLVAMGQATLIVGVRARRGRGRRLRPAPRFRAGWCCRADLLWLVLGYAFYCWVYAAAGSMAERQDQVQTLVLPLTPAHHPRLRARPHRRRAPATRASSSRCSPTCRRPHPSAMPVLVGLDQVAWWQFVISVRARHRGHRGDGTARRRHLPPGRAPIRGNGCTCVTCGRRPAGRGPHVRWSTGGAPG